MHMTAILIFALGVGFAMASPGPAVAALLAQVLGRGRQGAAAFCAGLILGDVVWFSAAMFGLAALLETAQPVFLALKYGGAAYLLFLAWRLWTAPIAAPAEAVVAPGPGWRRLAGGLMLTLGNPKTMVFYVALAPALVDTAHLTATYFALLVAVLAVVYTAILTIYVVLAARARRLLGSPRAMRRVNRAAGTLLAGAAVAVATR